MAAHSNHKVTLASNSHPRSHPRYAMPHEADEYAPLRASGHLPGRSPVFPLCHLPLHQGPKLSVRLETRWEAIPHSLGRPRRRFSHEGLWGNTGPRVWSGSRWGSRNPEVVGQPPSYPSSVPGTFKVHHPTNPTANHVLISIRALVTSHVGGKGYPVASAGSPWPEAASCSRSLAIRPVQFSASTGGSNLTRCIAAEWKASAAGDSGR
jgi:hypothetical protein